MYTHYVTLDIAHVLSVDDSKYARYIKRIEGGIWIQHEIRRTRAGTFRIFIVDAERAYNDGVDVFTVFDMHGETVNYFRLYGDDLEFLPAVIKLLPGGERFAPGMLILDRLEILLKYRGHGIGLRVLRALQFQFSMGCGIVAMNPYPLQFEGGTPRENVGQQAFIAQRLDTFPTNFKKSLASLTRYYGRLGFKKVPGLEYMVADPYVRTPDLDDEQDEV